MVLPGIGLLLVTGIRRRLLGALTLETQWLTPSFGWKTSPSDLPDM